MFPPHVIVVALSFFGALVPTLFVCGDKGNKGGKAVADCSKKPVAPMKGAKSQVNFLPPPDPDASKTTQSIAVSGPSAPPKENTKEKATTEGAYENLGPPGAQSHGITFEHLPFEIVERIVHFACYREKQPWRLRGVCRAFDQATSSFLAEKNKPTVNVLIFCLENVENIKCQKFHEDRYSFQRVQPLENIKSVPAFANFGLLIQADGLTVEHLQKIRRLLFSVRPDVTDCLKLSVDRRFPKHEMRKFFKHPKLRSVNFVVVASRRPEKEFMKFFTGLIHRKKSIKEIKFAFDGASPDRKRLQKFIGAIDFNLKRSPHVEVYKTDSDFGLDDVDHDVSKLLPTLLSAKKSLIFAVDFLQRPLAFALHHRGMHTFRTASLACYPLSTRSGKFPHAILSRSSDGMVLVEPITDTAVLRDVCTLCVHLFGSSEKCRSAKWKEGNVIEVGLACSRDLQQKMVKALAAQWKKDFERVFSTYLFKTDVVFDVKVVERLDPKSCQARFPKVNLKRTQMHIPLLPEYGYRMPRF
ncbi:hypothetical protein QR680_018151 [Steinernema hermaphroditum]|uniref:F-box domain-containing protein n=1 Tax=Steinernema hermaphroditum TaxID=289476 RepID=A0AA39LQM5_9BILA|nr:hypothetical protein QR680_018151 [Steinernema hermaphroditum]